MSSRFYFRSPKPTCLLSRDEGDDDDADDDADEDADGSWIG